VPATEDGAGPALRGGASIVVTGAAGFVGRQVTDLLCARGDAVIAIARRPRPAGVDARVEWVQADLVDAKKYETALAGAGCVLHLAAVTGKARPSEYVRSNVEATRQLIGACERAGVGRFVFMSSIAANFADRRFYPYADSKRAAEQLVHATRLPHTIIRPTMIFGPESPVQAGLERLARLPWIPVFGSGQTRVQPVDVHEVAALLGRIAGHPADASLDGATIEIGGPTVFTIDDLLRELRTRQGLSGPTRLLHLPLGPLRWVLGMLEPLLLSVLPLTAGQLATFANDGVAQPHPLATRLLLKPAVSPVHVPTRAS
jgi:nucleoside-diphosphate-sugar epimerase